MTRITTPFDSFMSDFTALWDEFWVIGVIVLGAAMIIAFAMLISRSRVRARLKQPQYRRHTYWE